jgi:hypothetical protein
LAAKTRVFPDTDFADEFLPIDRHGDAVVSSGCGHSLWSAAATATTAAAPSAATAADIPLAEGRRLIAATTTAASATAGEATAASSAASTASGFLGLPECRHRFFGGIEAHVPFKGADAGLGRKGEGALVGASYVADLDLYVTARASSNVEAYNGILSRVLASERE